MSVSQSQNSYEIEVLICFKKENKSLFFKKKKKKKIFRQFLILPKQKLKNKMGGKLGIGISEIARI
jgi:hypothetical protein